jgi:tRNA(fMet)-specific endonuclease VapC
MRRYLLDSNALQDFAHRRGFVYARARREQALGSVIGTTHPVVAEILAGIECSTTRDRNRPIVERRLRMMRLWPFDLQAAREYAALYGELRRKGIVMQTIDLMIAAISRTVPRCTVVSNDSDLGRVPGIVVEDWSRGS